MKLLKKYFETIVFPFILFVAASIVSVYPTESKSVFQIIGGNIPIVVASLSLVWLIYGLLRRYFNLKFDGLKKELEASKTELATYRKNAHENTLRNTTEISNLWEKLNGIDRSVTNLSELNKLMQQTSSITTRTIVNCINGLKTDDEIIKVVDALYANCTIQEFESIGLRGDIIHIMKARYHAEKLGEAEKNISFK